MGSRICIWGAIILEIVSAVSSVYDTGFGGTRDFTDSLCKKREGLREDTWDNGAQKQRKPLLLA